MGDIAISDAGSEVLEAGFIAADSREQHLIQAQIIAAKKFPRDEDRAIAKMRLAFRRIGLASSAVYRFPRGSTQISGPSINAAREMARLWGNISCAIRIISIDEKFVHIIGQSMDCETNTVIASEAKFKKLVQRKEGWVQPNERDLRELIGKHGAIAVRNSILQLLPRDVVEEMVLIADKTLKSSSKKDLKGNKETVIQSLLNCFAQVKVEKALIEEFIGHSIEGITDEELTELRGIYKSIFDGVTKRGEHFNVKDGTGNSEQADRLNESFGINNNNRGNEYE